MKEVDTALSLLREIKDATILRKIGWILYFSKIGLEIGLSGKTVLQIYEGRYKGYAIRIIANKGPFLGVMIENKAETRVLIVENKEPNINIKQIVAGENTVSVFVIEMQDLMPVFETVPLDQLLEEIFSE